MAMDPRKGFFPITAARSPLKPELTSPSASVTQERVASVLSVDGHSSATSNVETICNGLRRYALLSASSKSDSPLEHPDAPFTSLLRRATPTPSSPASSHTSSHSRASSRSREELAADIRRIIPPSYLPPVSERIAAAPCWPKSSTLSKHSSDSSNASTTSLRTPSPALSVPELTPSKSDSAFDTTSTRKSFAPAAEPRNLYGPLFVDETCFEFDAEDQVPDVTWTLITKDNPFLLNNCVAKINTIWSGDESIVNAMRIEEQAYNQRKNLKAQAKQAKAQRMMVEQQWQEVKKMAVSHQAQRDEEHAKKVELAEKISKALKAQDAAHKQETTQMGNEVPLLSKEGKLPAAEDRLSKSTIGQQSMPQEKAPEAHVATKVETEDSTAATTTSDDSWETCSDTAGAVATKPARDIESPKNDEEDECAIESCTLVCKAPRVRYT